MSTIRKWWLLAIAALVLLSPSIASADGMYSQNFTTVVAGPSINNIGTAIAFHQLTWTVVGTASVCTVALDTSADGITWSAGGAITGQTCTSNGTSTVTNHIVNYVRINVTAITVTAGSRVNIVWNGYVNNPGGGGTIAGSIAANQVAFGSAANTIAGSNNLQYTDPGGSCGLTVEAAYTQCGNGGGGTTFGTLSSLSESIAPDDSTWSQIYSNSAGTGNTGATRKTFLALGQGTTASGDEFDMDMFYNGAIQSFIAFGGSQVGRPSGVTGGLNFDGNGKVELGVNNSDLTQTEWSVIPNGDMQLITETGKGLCIQGTTSGQGCLSVDATSTTMTETLPFAITSDGVHPGAISLTCQTTLPALASNAVTLLGCPGATNTAWSLQMPTAIPTTNHLLSCVVTGTNCVLTDSGVAISGSQVANANVAAAPLPTPGSTCTFAAPRTYCICTTTCTITVPVPAAGYEFCGLNGDNVATVITMSAIGSSARYENTARTAYGTAGTGTFVSGGAVGDKACLLGLDSTHYLTVSFTGAWTAN